MFKLQKTFEVSLCRGSHKKMILVFLVVNLVLVSMFRVCCETGPIFVCAFTKKIPQQDGLETIPVGGNINPEKIYLNELSC